MAEVGDIADDALKYDTYEQYLDSQISQMDLYYLEDQDMWNLSGIFRDVYLYSLPTTLYIQDFRYFLKY